jgi:hypothetical protein
LSALGGRGSGGPAGEQPQRVLGGRAGFGGVGGMCPHKRSPGKRPGEPVPAARADTRNGARHRATSAENSEARRVDETRSAASLICP